MVDEREFQVREIVGALVEPQLSWKINDLQLLRYLKIENNVLRLTIELIADDPGQKEQFRSDVYAALAPLDFSRIDLTIRKANVAGQGIEGIRRIFMVASGKGGVGKSSIAVNLAVTLKQRGYRVGLLDADIYGPSVPLFFNIAEQKPRVLSEEVLEPLEAQGIKMLSIGNLVPRDTAVSWRGQLVSGTILQFVRKTDWGFLDFLIIDMPPGTGDVQITLASELKVTGAIMVSMEQELVLGDVVRSINHLRDRQIPLVGIVNNMTSFCCEKCGHEQTIFTGKSLKLEDVKVLSRLPLERDFCLAGNAGTPYMSEHRSGKIVEAFNRIADALESFMPAENRQ